MGWFKDTFGFEEKYSTLKQNLPLCEGHFLYSKKTNKKYDCGVFITPSLKELREKGFASNITPGTLKVSYMDIDVASLHNEDNEGAVFQVSSQFNCLEFINPHYASPENGVSIYDQDKTQGPRCAIQCGAATVFRNYYVNLDGQEGQTSLKQVNCLENCKINGECVVKVKNGYTFATDSQLDNIANYIKDEKRADELRSLIKVGISKDAQITNLLVNKKVLVTQVFCSAVSLSYADNIKEKWEPFAKLVLEAVYESTLWATLLYGKSKKVYLNYVGGRSFGNDREWIESAISRALEIFKNYPLEVIIVTKNGR